MELLIIGYGAMGKEVEKQALNRGHKIAGIWGRSQISQARDLIQELNRPVAIEFTGPESAAQNILLCLELGIPVVSGSTGWMDQWTQVQKAVDQHKGTLFWASNFSLGVALFNRILAMVAPLMAPHELYRIAMEEVHHTRKKDAPSGTAITLAQTLIKNNPELKEWILQEKHTSEPAPGVLPVRAFREGDVPGTHRVIYDSPQDRIVLEHQAKGRQGFALGAVLAAEFIENKKGSFGMEDLIK